MHLSSLSRHNIGNKTKKNHLISNGGIFLQSPRLLLVGSLPLAAIHPLHLPVAAYENGSRKRPAPVTDTFFASRWCLLTRASTIFQLLGANRCCIKENHGSITQLHTEIPLNATRALNVGNFHLMGEVENSW